MELGNKNFKYLQIKKTLLSRAYQKQSCVHNTIHPF